MAGSVVDRLRDLDPALGGLTEAVRPLLEALGTDGATQTDITEAGQSWRRWTGSTSSDDLTRLSFDPTALRFSTGGAPSSALSNATGGILSFPEPRATWQLDAAYAGDPADPDYDGRFRLHVVLPSAVLKLPFLRGAMLDARGLLVADPAHPQVAITLPRLGLAIIREVPSGAPTVALESATVAGAPAEDVFGFCRMDPPHALVGPGGVFGFSFRTAVLDLSGDRAPQEARAIPAAWQGIWLPLARIYVAPEGLEGIACSGGVRDLFIGFGPHAGVTGTFDVEVLRKGARPTVRLRLHGPTGAWFDVPDGEDGSTVTATAPATATLVVEADGGLAPRQSSITVDGRATADRWTAEVSVPDAGEVSVVVRVASSDGAGGPGPATTRTVRISRAPVGPGGGGAGGGTPDAVVVTTSPGPTRVVVTDRPRFDVILALDPPDPAHDPHWTVDGADRGTSATLTLTSATASSHTVTANRGRSSSTRLAAYWPFDRPEPGDDRLEEDPPDAPYSAATAHDGPAQDRAGSSWTPDARPLRDTLGTRLAGLAGGTTLTVTGYASFEGDDSAAKQQYNQALSERRAGALKAMIDATHPGLVVTASGVGHTVHAQPAHRSETAASYWRAEIAESVPDAADELVTASVTRGSPDTPVALPPVPTAPPPDPGHPSWFRRLRVEVELHRSRFVRCEITGEVDLVTATEAAGNRLERRAGGDPVNPTDGVTTFAAKVLVDDATGDWSVSLAMRAVESDRDGLWQVDRQPPNSNAKVDFAGVFAGMGPLLSLVTPPSPSAGDLVPLALGTGLLAAATTVVHAKRVTLRGAELSVAAVGSQRQVALLLDLESQLFADFGVIAVPETKAITTRYKALGLALGVSDDGDLDDFRVLFDPSRGYTLDVPAGAVVARGPLGDVLRVLGVRVSRDNPVFLEADVGLAVDLGVVTVERARVRVRLDGPLSPSLTGLTASVDIPGTFRGKGTLDVSDDRLSGGIDVTFLALGLRAAAKVTVATVGDTTGVLVGAEVNLPAPLPLGNSGLAILGFLGGLGVNMRRQEPAGSRTPALDWLAAQPDQDPMDGFGWVADAGSFAIAAGLILGTTEGGFLFHLKGLLVLELPGPRLLIMAKADVLSLPPGLQNADQQGKFLAVVDISPAGISAGLVIDYSVVELVKVRVPVEAAFDFTNPANWHVDLGRFDDPVTVEVFSAFRGSGYLMIHGNGITGIPGLPALPSTGFALAVGFHLTFIWGNEDIGLYLKIGGGFDAVLSFEPVGLVGKIGIEGELRLFIVSIGANASLTVVSAPRDGDLMPSTWIHGEVCGEVDFWLFSVSGCVDFTIGDEFTAAVPPKPLVRDVVLVSRAPAHLEGSATAGPVDGVVATASEDGTDKPAPEPVPLDVIPVVVFDTAVQPGGGFAVTNGGTGFDVTNVPVVANHTWIRRGDRWWRYEVLSVDLAGGLDAGPKPATWWTLPGSPQPAAGSALALLSYLPEPLPRAVIAGEQRDAQAASAYGSTCDPAAPPTRFLWHWNTTPTGTDDDPTRGWSLDGVPWPDPDGTVRHTPAVARIQVTEPWRCGDRADLLRGVGPARVVGASVGCPDRGMDPNPWPAGSGDPSLEGPDALATIAAFVTAGVDLRSIPAAVAEQRHENRRSGCRGRVLRSPADDGAEPSRLGDPVVGPLVQDAWDRTGHERAVLVDALRVTDTTAGGSADPAAGLADLDLLLLVPRRSLDGALVVRALDASENELHRLEVASGEVVTRWTDLPEAWRNPDEPWREPVWLAAGAAAAMMAKSREGWLLVRVPVKPDGAAAVEVGWDPDRLSADDLAPGGLPAFYLVLAEGTVVSEQRRSDWDTAVADGRQHAISNALTKEETDHALLVPGGAYTVTVRWKSFYAAQEAEPGPAGGTDAGEHTQTFHFTASTTPPASLEPWILSTTPGADEQAVLLDETVRLVQATDGVVRLFDAYGERLEAVVRAASGRHPRPGGSRADAGAIVAHELGTSIVQALAGEVEAGTALRLVSPWEEAVLATAFDGDCPPPGSRPGHPVEIISYPFEPKTDHLLDVEAVRADGSRRLVLRRGFSTSRYRSAAELAGVLAGTRTQHRPVNRAPLDALGATPTGQQLEDAFVAAGLPRPTVPDRPRVTVLWDATAEPQPVGVVIEAPETLVHQRAVPRQSPVPDPRDAGRRVWRAEPTVVLTPVVTGAGVVVAGTVVGPGGDRLLVLLASGGRGGTLTLAFQAAADPLVGTPAVLTPISTVPLTRAPWEDDGPDGPWGA